MLREALETEKGTAAETLQQLTTANSDLQLKINEEEEQITSLTAQLEVCAHGS